MKKKMETDVVFLLDRSGSMGGIENDTIGGYNSYLDSQRKNPVKVTTVLFDDKYEMLYDRVDIKKPRPGLFSSVMFKTMQICEFTHIF